MNRFVFIFLFALLASSASAATWGTRAFAFHGRVAPGRGAFTLAHLICMQGTFNRLLMDTPQGEPTELLVPHHSEVMEMSLNGWAGLHPHAVLFIHLTWLQWLLGLGLMQSVLTRILDQCEIDLANAGLIQAGINPYFVRNNGTWKQLCTVEEVWSALNYMMKTVGSTCFACLGRDASGNPVNQPWFEWWCVPGASEAATPHVAIIGPLPTDLATAQAQVAFKQQYPGNVRSSNLYRAPHHCSDVFLALAYVVARTLLLKTESAKLPWTESEGQASGMQLQRVLRSTHDEYTEGRRAGQIKVLCDEDKSLQKIFANGEAIGGNFRVLNELAGRFNNNGVFVSEEARVMGEAQYAAQAAGRAAGGGADYTAEERKQRGLKGEGSSRDLKAAGGAAGSRANPDSQYYAMVCSRCPGRHWFSTVYTNSQVTCPQCGKKTTFNQLVEDVTRSGPLGTGKEGRAAGQQYAATCNQAEEAAAAEDVEVLSQQMGAMASPSPSKPPPPKKPKGGEGGSSSQAIELSQ